MALLDEVSVQAGSIEPLTGTARQPGLPNDKLGVIPSINGRLIDWPIHTHIY